MFECGVLAEVHLEHMKQTSSTLRRHNQHRPPLPSNPSCLHNAGRTSLLFSSLHPTAIVPISRCTQMSAVDQVDMHPAPQTATSAKVPPVPSAAVPPSDTAERSTRHDVLHQEQSADVDKPGTAVEHSVPPLPSRFATGSSAEDSTAAPADSTPQAHASISSTSDTAEHPSSFSESVQAAPHHASAGGSSSGSGNKLFSTLKGYGKRMPCTLARALICGYLCLSAYGVVHGGLEQIRGGRRGT